MSLHATISHRSQIKCEVKCGKCHMQSGLGQASRVYEGATFGGAVAQGTSEHAWEPKEGSNLSEKILHKDVTRDMSSGRRQVGPTYMHKGCEVCAFKSCGSRKRSSRTSRKSSKSGPAGDRYAFLKMMDSDNVIRLSRYMCETTDVFPLDARDLERNRTTWYS